MDEANLNETVDVRVEFIGRELTRSAIGNLGNRERTSNG